MVDMEQKLLIPQTQVPTGYEGVQRGIANKRQLAQGLLQQGLGGPGPNAQSWAQLLGSLAQTWAGKSIQKDADKQEGELNKQIQTKAAQSKQGFAQDLANGAPPEQLYQKWAEDPFLGDEVKRLAEVLTDKMKGANKFNEPLRLFNAEGNPVTGQFSETGNFRQLDGLSLPGKVQNVNGVAVDLEAAKPGSVLPQDYNKFITLGPDGKPQVNSEFLQAKTQVALAGSPKTDTKITVNNAKAFGEAAVKRLEASAQAAEGSIQTLGTLDNIRSGLSEANVGPFSSVTSWLQRVAGVGEKGLAARQKVEQGLSQLTLYSRKALQGQGQISDKETDLLTRASSGDINSLSSGEIKSLMNTLERLSVDRLNIHQRLYRNASGLEGAENGLELFKVDIPERYLKKPSSRSKPQTRNNTPQKSKERDTMGLLKDLSPLLAGEN